MRKSLLKPKKEKTTQEKERSKSPERSGLDDSKDSKEQKGGINKESNKDEMGNEMSNETNNESRKKITFKRTGDKKGFNRSNNETPRIIGTYVNEKEVSYNMRDNLNGILKTHLETEEVVKLGTKTHELEFRIGKYRPRGGMSSGEGKGYIFDAYIPRLIFNRMIKYYHERYGKVDMNENISLDVIYDETFRVSVTGQSLVNSKNEVELYCKTNKLRNPIFMEKVQVQKTDNLDWGYRITSSHEGPVNSEIQRAKLIQAVEDRTVSKFYRYKYRYSYNISDQIRVDFTIVKETPPGGMAGTLVMSKTLAQREMYQVEVEFIGSDYSVKNLERHMYEPLKELISLYNGNKGSHEPISESHSRMVLQKYLELSVGVKMSNEEIMQKPTTGKFLAMDVEALTRQNFNLIRNDYMVTLKADGEHYLLYMKPGMGIYLINNRLSVSQVVLNEIKDKEISKTIEGMGECIYDGELIEYEGKIRYLIFDCFYYGGVDKRDLPLYDKVGGKYVINDKSRIHYIKELMKVVTNEILSDELAIEEKVYYPMNKINRFFKQLVTDGRYVLNEDETPYNIDGLILMKANEGYPKVIYDNGRIIKRGSLDDERISPILKWKPVEFLSIDFMVKFMENNKIQRINGVDYMVMTLESAYGNKIYPFEPSCYRVKDYNKLYMPMTKGQPQMISREGYRVDNETLGHVIKNKDVLEFVWIPDRSFGSDYWGVWFPIKYREDKTQNGFPNNYKKVADRTWMAIHDKQILPENLMDPFGQNMTSPQLNMGYYQNENRDSMIELRNIHNGIKSVLIFLAIKQSGGGNKSRRLMDLASGRLGDLGKMLGINYVFGVEYDEGNLKAGDGSAYGRYREMIDKSFLSDRRDMTTIDLIQGDMRELFSENKVSNESIFNYIMKNRLGENKESFGIVSCQFAMHYACDSEEHLDNFMRNVSENLAPDGYFIATTFDGDKILNALNNSDKTDENGQPVLIGRDEDKKIMWSIASPVKYRKLENVGQKIIVFNKTIKEEEEVEYLVNFEYVVEVAKKYNMYPGRLSIGKYNLPLDGGYGLGNFTEAYTEDFMDLVGETVYPKGSPRYKELDKSYQNIPNDIKRYSKFSSFLILRKQS